VGKWPLFWPRFTKFYKNFTKTLHFREKFRNFGRFLPTLATKFSWVATVFWPQYWAFLRFYWAFLAILAKNPLFYTKY